MEKDKDILALISFILSEEGFEIKQAKSLFELNQHLESEPADAILLDVITPYTAEAEFCKKLKTTPQTKNIPVIVLSTDSHVTDALNTVCANDVISKPFDIDDLINIVKNQLLLN